MRFPLKETAYVLINALLSTGNPGEAPPQPFGASHLL
jgi:hypothetical protein